MRHGGFGLAVAALLLAGAGQARGQAPAPPGPDYPTQSVQIVVPYVPGGGTDVIARSLAEALHGALGKPFVVINKPGAAGMIGADLVARAKPDGYVLLMGYTSEIAVSPQLYATATYRAADFEPIVLAGETPLILIARNGLPGASLTAFVASAQPAPGRYNIATAGNGSPAQFASEMLNRQAGLRLQLIPYKGSGQAVADIIAGQVDLFFSGMAPVVPQLQAGTLKAFGITGDHRSAAAPDVPTMAELGYAGFDLSGWFGLFAPSGTPPPVIDRLRRAALDALEGARMHDALALQGVDVRPLAGDALRAFVAAETAKYRRLISELGITAE
jgi:tripartite-type tricarboxylate transporter receptor subunit TctC